MKIKKVVNKAITTTVVTLSESNLQELFYMLKLYDVNAARQRLQNTKPFLFKRDAGEGDALVVEIEKDETHYFTDLDL